MEVGVPMRRSQPIQRLLEDRGKAVVSFIRRSPEGVSADIFWSADDFEDTVVGWIVLEREAGKGPSATGWRSRNKHTLSAILHWQELWYDHISPCSSPVFARRK